MDNLECLSEFFDSGSAETEKSFLNDVFVTTEDFLSIIKPKNNTLKILVGNKGSGKSALLGYLKDRAEKLDIPVIQLTPTDFPEWNFSENASPASMISNIYASILKAMALELGIRQKGLLSDDDNRLLQEAIREGVREPTAVSKILNIIMPIGKAVTKIDFKEMLPSYAFTSASRERVVSSYMKDRKVFYVLLDDIDQICNACRSDYYDVIWAEVLALLKIAINIPNIVPIVSVRREIWRKLSINNGNRDKYDQIRNMVCTLRSDREKLKCILERRLLFCKERYEIKSNNLYDAFFEGEDCQVPNSLERRRWYDYLISSSRENPRDLIQLVSFLVRNAQKKMASRISDVDVENTALKYSEERVGDLIQQNEDMFSKIEPLIRSFSLATFEMQPEELRKHLSDFLGQGNIIFNGKTIKLLDDKVIKVWDLLFNIGFINPRAIDNTQKRGYSFIPYDETLVSWTRWNDVQKYTWDIHPCYRVFLYNLKEEEKKRIQNKDVGENYKGKTTTLQRKQKKGRIREYRRR
ncbi:P-loop ATPase, Sll1717 family [Selenomonas ruminantium]|uniref:KAP family P-loop domain-containing protein n=1 Tax=Selenomonas ruminantium TaxID=971 RepID=A0A1H0S1C8_SELRU|nr:hypothetical protein [Selenomonas ruminantium]SDP35425.1 hypothetical protein SAMN05216366_11513 [Selenomonas ruminantium]